MDWHDELIERLAARPCAGYGESDGAATEPSALAALALAASGRWDAARAVAHWLATFQAADGSVGVRPTETQPGWPTSLAVLTWSALVRAGSGESYQLPIERALAWMLARHGVKLPADAVRGHDGMLEAWPWVEDTHAWVEPTALHVLALHSVGLADHPRSRSAIAMLFDRQLACGGFNYGNTTVLGCPLRPHLQPTGIALLALANEREAARRVGKSVSYLRSNLGPETATASLCWSLLALAAFGSVPAAAGHWLEHAYRRAIRRGASHHRLALLALAGQHERQPLLGPPRRNPEASWRMPGVES